MKSFRNNFRLLFLVTCLISPSVILGQSGITGTWKYSSQAGEMNMVISAGTIAINGQTFPYKAQGNVLMINEGNTTTPYPYMLDGNRLSLEFPGGTEIVFSRVQATLQDQNRLPQSMTRPSGNTGQQGQALSGQWIFQNQQGQLTLEFLSADQLRFNGENARYQLKEGVIQVMGDYGWVDYPYTMSQGILNITFPDGSKYPFTKSAITAQNQQAQSQQANRAGGGATWQLKGMLCSWSGSSSSESGYSRTRRIVFDGQGNFQFGSEASFSSSSGIAYSGNPNVQTGTYSVGESIVTLNFKDGSVYQVKINIRQDNGMITELMYSGTLYATGLCN